MTNEALLEEIGDEFQHLKNIREIYEPAWKEAENYSRAHLSNWDGSDKRADRPRRYSSEAANDLDILVSGLMGYTISPNLAWMKLSLDKLEWLKMYGVKDWLENVEKKLYATFVSSNLYSEAPALFRDAGSSGHGVMLIDEDIATGKIRYTTRQTPEVYLDVNEHDEVDTVYRLYSMTIRQMASFFGKENLAPTIQHLVDDRTGKHNKVNILHAVYPRRDRDENSRDIKNAAWASVYVDWDHQHIIEESGYYEFPYAVFTWSRIPRVGYGDSPAQDAMPDILLLERAEESRIMIAQYSAQPALNVPEIMRGSESVIPGGYNYYKEVGQQIQPINTGANYPITIQVVDGFEKRIRNWFHVDFFLMLMQQTASNKTATEVVALQGEQAAILSPLIVNQSAALSAIIKRTFNILYRQGEIPEPPAALAGSGAQLKIEFVGPLAQAQKRYHQAGGIAQSLSLAQPVLGLFPQSGDLIDGDELLKAILDTNGFPQAALREDKDVEEIRQARAEQAQAAQAQAVKLQQQQMLLQNYNKINQPTQGGSPLAALDAQRASSIGVRS